MPYVHRTVRAGRTIEHRKMYTGRVHTKGTKRQANKSETTARQQKINERVAEERLRWTLNANFGWRDLHAVLHYYDKGRTLEQILEDRRLFLKRLRRKCAQLGIERKVVVVIETKRMTNPHIHVIISRMDPEIIAEAWDSVAGGGGISFRMMDRRGNHYKLASYLMKESKSTMNRCAEAGIRTKRYTTSQNLEKPTIEYKTISAGKWRKDPRARKGAMLYKFDDGATCLSGYHEASGYPYQEYFEVFNE